jgi:adenine C2-methylase RlmN of 23S rRNA A2503 and tRNA A37
MAKFRIPELCSAYVPMILKEFCSSKINGLVMKNFLFGNYHHLAEQYSVNFVQMMKHDISYTVEGRRGRDIHTAC